MLPRSHPSPSGHAAPHHILAGDKRSKNAGNHPEDYCLAILPAQTLGAAVLLHKFGIWNNNGELHFFRVMFSLEPSLSFITHAVFILRFSSRCLVDLTQSSAGDVSPVRWQLILHHGGELCLSPVAA